MEIVRFVFNEIPFLIFVPTVGNNALWGDLEIVCFASIFQTNQL